MSAYATLLAVSANSNLLQTAPAAVTESIAPQETNARVESALDLLSAFAISPRLDLAGLLLDSVQSLRISVCTLL